MSKAAIDTSKMSSSNVQPDDTMQPKGGAKDKMTYVMSEKRMVAPGSKDAPRFKSSKPEELTCFIRLMEDLWKDAGVIVDMQRKR